jgi:bacterioferritin (cytochrome b1)
MCAPHSQNSSGERTGVASEYGNADNLVEMIKENLIAERIAIDHYRELIRYFAEGFTVEVRVLSRAF